MYIYRRLVRASRAHEPLGPEAALPCALVGGHPLGLGVGPTPGPWWGPPLTLGGVIYDTVAMHILGP